MVITPHFLRYYLISFYCAASLAVASDPGSYVNPVEGYQKTNYPGMLLFGNGARSSSGVDVLRKRDGDDETVLTNKIMTVFLEEYHEQLHELLGKEWSDEKVDALVGLLLEATSNLEVEGIRISERGWRSIVNLLAYMSTTERGKPLSEHINKSYEKLFVRAKDLDQRIIKGNFFGVTSRAIDDYGNMDMLTESYWNNVQDYSLRLDVCESHGDKTTIERLKTIRNKEWAKSIKKRINKTIAFIEMYLQYPELRDLPSHNAFPLGERLYEIEEQRIEDIRKRAQGTQREDISKALTDIADRLSEESQGVRQALEDMKSPKQRDIEFRLKHGFPLEGPYFPNAKPAEVSKDL